MPAAGEQPRPPRPRLGRIGSAIDDHAGERAVDRDEDGVRASAAASSIARARRDPGRRRDPALLEQAGRCPTSTRVAVDRRLDAVAGPRVERRHRPEAELVALAAGDDRRPERVLAAAFRARPRGRAARRRPCRRPPRSSTTSGRPIVSVPVLSKMTVSMRCATSSASPPLMRMPASAPRPVPTMIAVGVARPIAHGQAMIDRGDRARQGAGEPGLRADEQPGDERDDAQERGRPARRPR